MEAFTENTAWTDDEIATLKRLVWRHNSFGQIASMMGRSRDAVSATVARLRKSGALVYDRKVTPVTFSPEFTEPGKLAEDEGLTLLDLGSRQCRFSTGQRVTGEWTFCGERTREVGASFCASHHQLSFVPIQRKR